MEIARTGFKIMMDINELSQQLQDTYSRIIFIDLSRFSNTL
jgi:Txe/YoeB family toxin of Txe-Axe toxin-antitoxin module